MPYRFSSGGVSVHPSQDVGAGRNVLSCSEGTCQLTISVLSCVDMLVVIRLTPHAALLQFSLGLRPAIRSLIHAY